MKQLSTAILLTGLLMCSAAYAGSGHEHADHAHGSESPADHDHHAPNTPEFEHKDYGSVAKAWQSLTKSVGDAETAVNENKMEAVHGIYPELAASAHYLLDHSDLEDEAKQTRLKAALGQLTDAIEEFHANTHSGLGPESKRELKKMQGALKLIGTYYPPEQLSAE